MKFKKILLILILLNLNNTYVFSIEPDVFVQSTVNRASDILSRNISKENKINELKKIAKDTVDIRVLVFIVLDQQEIQLMTNKKKIF